MTHFGAKYERCIESDVIKVDVVNDIVQWNNALAMIGTLESERCRPMGVDVVNRGRCTEV